MCEVNGEEELNAIPVMLSSDALIYQFSHARKCKAYTEAVNTL